MHEQFKPNAAAMLIGSQPLKEHKEANRLVLEYTPDIPNWVQLPAYRNEGMVDQFMDGLPGLVRAGANIIGGCCGTTPDHIRAIREAVDNL